MVKVWLIGAALLAAAPVQAQAGREAGWNTARAQVAADYDRIVADVITLTEIPAPPFKETARGLHYAGMMRAHGLKDVAIDAVGNVTGLRPGGPGGAMAGGKLLVVSAHLDTVFPEGTPIKVRREGDRLLAPGIGDDTVGLAALLAWMRALDAGKVVTGRDILFVATVGEEGEGDLRGARHLFTKNDYRSRIGDFISVDGSTPYRVVDGGVGSRRYRVEFTGPGGHSYGAYGLVNPMAAMAGTVQRLYTITTPKSPKTTYAASVVSGGTSVNAIPNKVEMLFDMRSESAAELAKLEAQLMAMIGEAVAAENAARDTKEGKVAANPVLIGDRPAGMTPRDEPLVKAVAGAVAANGYEPVLGASSTDSNVPMNLGVPAVTIGAGGGGGRAHSLDEYLNVERAAFVRGMQTGLDVVIAAAAVPRN